ncbi:E3 ubiquitin-protein ligase listerin [Ischnura elegans]|uniref:E3 ubiquitin-protein ligase listerin n=1 Tax=Ischnura elegans TaxID=197161 RepID=UPI001ED8B9C6|nr:E3 ubiquitin-protein ligase listerin [Ischnura elegans]
MGGKHKQAQRTKNNSRPSSSGRSAELLRNTAFVGFTAVKDGSAPILPGFSLNPDEADTQGNSEFNLVMKKMYKKDSTTKLKALQEFADLCKRSDGNEIKGALPLWPHIYNLLAMDADHRVREASHQAQRQLALVAKKNLAPYLKALAGPWFTGMYDTYPPAASAARQAFQDAFPPAKTVEAISFCQEEIFNYIFDNLVNQNANTLSNPKNSSAEEMEAKYTRTLISSLQGYSYFLQQLPAKVIKNSESNNHKLLSSSKFWKYARHNSPMVRSSWFSALIAICQKAPFLLEDQGSQVAHAVFGNLDETDPGTLPVVWEAALHALVTIKDCWSHIDPHKVVFPKLWRVLKEGGQGNASTIYPNLLPLLSKIPRELLNDRDLFYKRFFSNMREGFNQPSVQLSQSESNAVSVTFIECLRYTVMMHQDDEAFCTSLLIDQLIPVLKDSFSEKKWKSLIRPLYSQMSSLVHHWHKNISECPCFKALTRIFWEQVTDTIAESVHENQDTFAFMSRNQLEFILYLKDPTRQKKRENLKVGFVDSEEEKGNVVACDSSEPSASEDLGCKDFENQLISLVLETCEEYCSGASVNSSRVFVDAMTNLVIEFNSVALVSHLACKAKGEDDSPLLLEKLLSWLHDPTMCTSNLVKLLFLILVHLQPEEKQSILTSLLELNNLLILQWCLINAVNSHSSDDVVRKWLKSPQISEIIVTVVRNISTNSLKNGVDGDAGDFQTTWDVLKCCFSKTSDGDFPVSMETLISIVKVLCDAISPKTSTIQTDPNSSARFVGELTCALFSRESKSSVPLALILLEKGDETTKSPATGGVLCDLALSMFTTCCIGHHHASVLHTSTLSLLGTAWQTLVSSMALALGIGSNVEPFLEVTDKFAKATWMSISPLNEIASLEVASNKAVSFMKAALEACTCDDVLSTETVLASLCQRFFNYGTNSPRHASNKLIMQMCLAAEFWRNCTVLKKEVIVEDNDPEKFLQSISVSLFMMNVLSNVGSHCGYLAEDFADDFEGVSDELSKIEVKENLSSIEGEEEKSSAKKVYEEFLLKFLDHVTESLNEYTLCKLFLLHFKNDPLSLKINPKYKLLKSHLKKVIGSMSDGGMQQLKNRILDQVEEYNGLGLWAIKFMYSELLLGKDAFTAFADLNSISSLSRYHVQMIQVFSSSLPKEELEELSSESSKALYSLSTNVPAEGEASIEIWPRCHLSVVVCALRSMTIPWNGGEDKKMENAVKTALDSILLTRQSGISSIFSKDMSLWTYSETSAAVEVADFLEGCVKNCRKMLSANQWDLLLCSMVAWVQSLAAISEKHINIDSTRKCWWHSVDHAALASSIFRLVATVVGTIEGVRYTPVEGPNVDDKEEQSFSSCLPEDLVSEWNDVYADEIYHPLIRMFSLMTDCKMQRNTSWGHLENLLFEDIVSALRVIPANCLSKCPFPCLVNYENENRVSFLASDLVATLRSPVIPLQTAAYLLILKLVPDLVEEDKKILSTEGSDSEKVWEKLSCHLLEDQLSEAQSVVDTMLMDFRVGDSCTVQPFTDTYTYTSAYFLQWKVILEMCRVSEPELRCHYAQWLKDTGHLSSLLDNVFRLLPDQLLQGCSIQVNSPSSKMLSRLFESKLSAQSYHGAVTTENLERLVCWVWVDTFRYLPALVRHWWNYLEARSNSLVERLTAVYLSPLLCAEEMRAVQAEEKTFANMMVKVHHTAREVIAVYSVDDAEAELMIQLPTNHPLGLVKVECGKYLFGINQSHNWRRQITIFLNYQNGSIWDGLALWKKYLDRRFEGVEECFICYSILHNSNYQIPKLSCHTCKKKFHSQCLYKWFSTSNNSTCPICRNLWKY